MTRPVRVLAGLVCGLLAGSVVGTPALPGGTAPAAAQAGPVVVDVLGTTPTTLTPGGTFTVSGRLRNVGDRVLRGVRVDVRIKPERLPDRAAVRVWPTGRDDDLGQVELTTAVTDRLGPGQDVRFQLRGRVDDFDLPDGAASFGPRGVSVQAVGRTGNATPGRTRVLGERRTFTVWNPAGAPPAVRVGLLVPLVSARPVPEVSEPTPGTLAELTPTGRLGRLTGVAGRTPGITWLVDPGLLLAAARAVDPEGLADPGDVDAVDPTATPTDPAATPTTAASPGTPDTAPSSPTPESSTPGPEPTDTEPTDTEPTDTEPTDTEPVPDVEGTRTWLDTLRSTADGQELYALPYGDPDLAALAHDRQLLTLRAARAVGVDAARRAIGRTLPDSLGWPADGLADRDTLDLLASAGVADVVLGERTRPGSGPDGSTASPRTRVDVGPGRSIGGLVGDDALSATLADAGRSDGAAARQLLVAELAALARENRRARVDVVLTAPRDWDVDAGDLSATLAALDGTGWLQPTPVSALLDTPATRAGDRTVVYPGSARAAELPREPLRTAADARRRLGRFGSALVNPDPVLVPLRRQALTLAGVSWRRDPERMRARATALARTVDAFYAGVRVPTGSDKLLLARTGDLPLTVENRLAVPVTVVVGLRPRSGRLVVDEQVTVQVPARGRTNALVPVRAIADGDVQVDASLFTPDRVRIAQTTSIDVRVRSDWEGRGIALVAVVLLVLLVVGLVRGVRGGRRPSVPPESVPDPDDIGRVLVDDDGRVIEPDTAPMRLRAPR